MEKRFLLVDMDNVLYSLNLLGEPSILKSALGAAKKLGLSEEVEKKLVEASKVVADELMYGPFWDLVGCKEFETSVFNQEIVRNTDYSRICSNVLLLSILKQLQQRYNVIIFTDNTIYHADKIFQAIFGCGVVDADINVYSIESAKHGNHCLIKKKGGLDLFCQIRDINPDDCILIDDSEENIDVANAMGMETFHFKEDMNINEVLLRY